VIGPRPVDRRVANGAWAQLLIKLVAIAFLASQLFLAAWVAVPAMAQGLQPVVIVGGSMAPSLEVGDVVLVDRDAVVPAVGEVITYTGVSGSLVTHRVVARAPDGDLVTKGDANAAEDGTTVPVGRVHGVGRLAVPAAGLPAVWARTEQGRLAGWVLSILAATVLVVRVRPIDPPARVVVHDDDDDEWSWPRPAVTS
jgi:signal peptidase